ncbi:hypothetical protein IT575_03295 [bacterium]|nr:hypothetical protein [bacterium]
MRRTLFSGAAALTAAAVGAVGFVHIGWGAGGASLQFVDLPDRDAVVLRVDGTALTSDLIARDESTGKLEVLYAYDNTMPALPQSFGDLITGARLEPADGGFKLVLSLADSLPAGGASFYRESVIGDGATVVEVFSPETAQTPFKASWAAPGGFVADSKPLAKSHSAVSMGPRFDAAAQTLTIPGGASQDYSIQQKQFPNRIDIALPSTRADSASLGMVHKDLSGKVTYIEVVESKSAEGVVVRANLAPDYGVVNKSVSGDDLVLTFGKSAAAPSAPAAKYEQSGGFGQSSFNSRPSFAEVQDDDASEAEAVSTLPALGESLSEAVGSSDPYYVSDDFTETSDSAVPSVDEVLAKARNDARGRGDMGNGGDGDYGSYKLPEFAGADEELTDVRVNLNATGGFSLYQFLMYMSTISGIPIIIDPYWFNNPTGSTRTPLDPGEIPNNGGGAGFRPGSIFDPQLGQSGTVLGNFDNVPWEKALGIVLQTHNLKYVTQRDENDPYAKPIILVTSKERLEQELEGQNTIDLYQLHYADPFEVTNILEELNMLPSLTVGWYVYSGGRGGGGNTGGGGGGNRGGGRGGGGRGGGGGGGGVGGGGGRGTNSANYATLADEIQAAGAVSEHYGVDEPLQIGGGGNGGGNAGGGGGGGNAGGGRGNNGGGGGNNGNGGVGLDTAKTGLIVMRGTRKTLDAVQSLIAKIDRPPKQMALKVKVYQVSDDPQEVYGLLRATAQSDRIRGTYELGSLAANILPKGGVLLDENYTAAFEFLSQQRKAKLVTETEVAVLDGFQATINNTRTRGQLSGTLVITPDGQVINQPQFNSVTVGTNLTFTPQIDDRGRITLIVRITLSNFDGPEQVASANGQQVTFQPTVNTTLNTFLRMVDGQTALIGGLTTTEDSVQFTGIPFLSKLPIIGKYLGRTEHDRSTSHIFITIQANIIDDK